MCDLLSYKKDGKLTGELISNLEEIQKELFPDSELRMTNDLWQKFAKEKREEKAWKNLTGAEKEKFSDAEKDKRDMEAVHAFIQSIQRERFEKERRIQHRKEKKKKEKEKEKEDGDDESKENHHFIKEEYEDEDKRQRGERVPLQQLNK